MRPNKTCTEDYLPSQYLSTNWGQGSAGPAQEAGVACNKVITAPEHGAATWY